MNNRTKKSCDSSQFFNISIVAFSIKSKIQQKRLIRMEIFSKILRKDKSP